MSGTDRLMTEVAKFNRYMAMRSALQRLADAAGRLLDDSSEASEEVRAELRWNLHLAEDAARDILAADRE